MAIMPEAKTSLFKYVCSCLALQEVSLTRVKKESILPVA